MNLYKALYRLVVGRRGGGLFYRTRASLRTAPTIGQLIAPKKAELPQLATSDRVCVVGAGIASLTFVTALRRLGHDEITIISRRDQLGGKCVNSGCMPSEYFFHSSALAPEARAARGAEKIEKLRALTADAFAAQGCPMVEGEVSSVDGTTLRLTDGQEIRFDRLVFATGNRADAAPDMASRLGDTVAPEDFWTIQAQHLLLVTTNNPAILGYADMALDRGMTVTVLFESDAPLAHLPAYQLYQREIVKRGVVVMQGARVTRRIGERVEVDTRTSAKTIPCDAVLFYGQPRPNVPPIDGQKISLSQIDFATGTLAEQPDISFAGDAAGMLSAAEAEVHAQQLAQLVATGDCAHGIDSEALSLIPYRLHGNRPLAMVGAPWTFLHRTWDCVDFKLLGWSLLHDLEGKLWYRFDAETRCVEAIHICHRDAGELINLAALLLHVPIDDARWRTSFVHPSAAEIFKLVADEIRARHVSPRDAPRNVQVSMPPARPEPLSFGEPLELPSPREPEAEAFFDQHFSEAERIAGLLDPNPTFYFGILLAVKALLQRNGMTAGNTTLLSRGDDDRYVSVVLPDLRYEGDERSLSIYAGDKFTKVNFKES